MFSDNKDFFHQIFEDKIKIIPLTAEMIQKWRGEIDFVHRVKIEVLIDFFKRFEGHCFYIDSDTIFLDSPAEIIKGIENHELYMHINEGMIKSKINPIFKKMYKFLKAHTDVPLDSQMWNAGMIGIHNDDKDLLYKILNLTDEWYIIFPKHVIEQFAVSYILQSQKPIKATDHIIHHFWDFKEFRNHIDYFFDSNPGKKYKELLALKFPNPIELKPKPLTFIDILKRMFT